MIRARRSRPQRSLSIASWPAHRLTPAVLRTWEARHGFPVPTRAASGHRWYRESDVDLVQRVVHRQRAGVRLEAAIREVTAYASAPMLSLFAMLRERPLAPGTATTAQADPAGAEPGHRG